LHFRLQFAEQTVQGFAAGIENDGPLGAQLDQFETRSFAHAPADPVPDDRLAERPRRGETDSGTRAIRHRQAKGREIRGRITRPEVVNLSELGRS
jgi:hypothetical protein